jgi:hypothetical protein
MQPTMQTERRGIPRFGAGPVMYSDEDDEHDERSERSGLMNEKYDGEPARATSARDFVSEQPTISVTRRSVATSSDDASKASSWESNKFLSGFPLKRYKSSRPVSTEQTDTHDSNSNDNHCRERSQRSLNSFILSQTRNQRQKDSLALVQRESATENEDDVLGSEPGASHPDMGSADKSYEESCLGVATAAQNVEANVDAAQDIDNSVLVLIRAMLDLSSALDAVGMQDSAMVVVEAFQGRVCSLTRVSALYNSWASRFTAIHRARDQNLKAKLIQSLNVGTFMAKSSGHIVESVVENVDELLDSIQNGDLNMCVYGLNEQASKDDSTRYLLETFMRWLEDAVTFCEREGFMDGPVLSESHSATPLVLSAIKGTGIVDQAYAEKMVTLLTRDPVPRDPVPRVLVPRVPVPTEHVVGENQLAMAPGRSVSPDLTDESSGLCRSHKSPDTKRSEQRIENSQLERNAENQHGPEHGQTQKETSPTQYLWNASDKTDRDKILMPHPLNSERPESVKGVDSNSQKSQSSFAPEPNSRVSSAGNEVERVSFHGGKSVDVSGKKRCLVQSYPAFDEISKKRYRPGGHGQFEPISIYKGRSMPETRRRSSSRFVSFPRVGLVDPSRPYMAQASEIVLIPPREDVAHLFTDPQDVLDLEGAPEGFRREVDIGMQASTIHSVLLLHAAVSVRIEQALAERDGKVWEEPRSISITRPPLP